MKNGVKKKVIIAIVCVVILILIALVYFLFINKTNVLYLGFSNPNYSPSSLVGSAVGEATESNPWTDLKLNPFANETS